MQLIIYEASFSGLFRLLLILTVVYAVYKIITRLIVPALMKKYIKNFQQRYTEQNQYQRNSPVQKKEGEVSITFVDKDKNKARNPDDGEYVDYEEIK
jgi:hypothetical protein